MKTNNKIKMLGLGLLALLAVGAVGARDTVAKADYAGRDYNSAFDVMVDDFSSSTPKGTPSNADDYNANPYLLVELDNSGDTKAGHSEDSSIYKQATGNYAIHNYSIKFRMKGTLALSELTLGLRGDDAWDLYPINLASAMDIDGDEMPVLSATEYQDYVISLNNSIDDDTVQYKMRGTDTDSGTNVMNLVLGFHLYATDSSVGTIAIEKVSLVDASGETVIEDFNHKNPNDADPNLWWRDSVGKIIPRHIALNNSSYEVGVEGLDKVYENVVVSLEADVAVPELTLTASFGEEKVSATYAQLKDAANLPELNAGRVNVIIPHGADAILTGVKVEAGANEVRIYQVFVSNLESREAERVYPALDTANAVVFDNFNRTQSGFNGDYEASASDPLILNNGLYYALSYNNGDKVKVENGSLVFDATNLAENDYINFKEGSTRTGEGKDYVVIVARGEDGASLAGFRFSGNVVKWSHEWRSAFGLNVPELGAQNYPYTTEDGYQWLVIDMAETGFTVTDTIDMYYSGTGKLYIDEIFFADKVEGIDYNSPVAGGDPAEVNIVGDNYAYTYGGYADGLSRYFEIQASGDGTITLESLRIEHHGVTKSIKDKQLYAPNGELISAELTTEVRTIVVDLELSGFNWKVADHVHVHFGSWGVGGDGTISVKSYKFYHAKGVSFDTVIYADALGEKAIDGAAYGYLFGNINPNPHAEYMVIKLQATAAGENLLESVRLTCDGQSGEFNFNANEIIAADGSVIGMNAIDDGEEHTLVIDLRASGFDVPSIINWHFHAGGWGPSTTINFKEISVISYQPNHAAVMASKTVADVTRPTVTWEPSLTATEGDVIEVNPTVSDDLSATENITVDITVTKGSGDDAVEVELVDNKFTAEVGVYTIEIVVTDEAGNSSSTTVQITVSAKPVEPGPGDDTPTTSGGGNVEEPSKKGCGKASASIVGAIALVSLVSLVVLAKKKD